jgi:hypothetical protein
MSVPRDKDRSRPGGGYGSIVAVAHADTRSRPADLRARGEAEFLALHHAEGIVALEFKAIEAARMLTTEQLRAVVWLGLLDEGWSRVTAELAHRGEGDR